MSNFAIYLTGFIVFLCGLGYGAHLLGVSHTWIGVGAVIMLGIAIMSGVSRTRAKDPSPPP